MKSTLHPLFGTRLPTGWILTTVDDVKSSAPSSCVAGPFGSNIASKYFADAGVPVIRGSNLRDDLTRFVPNGFVFVTPERAGSYGPQHVRSGDLVFTCWGTVGQVGLIPDHGPFPQYIISNKQLKLRPDLAKANPEYLFYYFASPQMVAHVRNRAVGSAVPGINLGILKSLPVVLPPLPTQRKIAAVLSAYDDLIENNTRRIAILEEMAQAIYREWFVEFRYPGHEVVPLVDSDLGPIPEGWELRPLFEVAETTFGFPFKAKLFNSDADGTPVIRIRDLPKNGTGTFTTEKAAAQYEVEDGDLLIGMDGDFHMCKWSAGPAYLNQRVVRFRPAGDELSRYEIFLALERPVRELNGSIVGTTVAHLGKRHLEPLRLLVPGTELRHRSRDVFDPIFDQVIRLRKATVNLRATRDLLLPRLISGEVDVSRLDLDVGDAAA